MSNTNDDDTSYLLFTTTQSDVLEGKPTFEGVYTCLFDFEKGTCQESPMIVSDVWDQSGEHHRGLDIMNLQMDHKTQFLYAGYYDGNRDSFEILRASTMANPVGFKSFFRTAKYVWNNPCDNPLECCDALVDAGDTFFKVTPRDFVVDGDDIFVSWDGFYQNCRNEYSAKQGLMWTIGVSKLIRSPECESTDGLEEVKFEECSQIAAIAFQDSTANEKVLGYAGIAMSKLPGGKSLFFLSALDHVGLKENKLKPKLFNELWVIREGQDYSKDSRSLQVFGRVEVDPVFMDVPCDDVGSIELRNDDNGMASAVCRSAYDAGIFCHSISVSDEGVVEIVKSHTFVTKKQVAESCKVVKSDHHPSTKHLSSVSTGIAVVWKDDSPGDIPHLITHGCYGEINYQGNITTVFSDGKVVQAVEGAYPGSVLFGPDLHHEEYVPHDVIPTSKVYPPPGSSTSNSRTTGLPRTFFFSALVVAAALLFMTKRRRWNPVHNGCLWRQYQRVHQHGDALPSEDVMTVPYVELSSTSHEDEAPDPLL